MLVHNKIRDLLDEIFEFAHSEQYENMGKMEFARYVGLSYSCLYNLRKHNTLDPRSSTLLKLCSAVGLSEQLAAITHLPIVVRKRKTKPRIIRIRKYA